MPRLFSGGRDLEGVLGILECVNRVLLVSLGYCERAGWLYQAHRMMDSMPESTESTLYVSINHA